MGIVCMLLSKKTHGGEENVYQFDFLEYDRVHSTRREMSRNTVLNREVELLSEFLIDEGRKLVFAILRLNEARTP